ncbi:MAG: ribonuclease J, partial [Armatimonadetes bacterium]|nr:ribonuclease J [Armatimonadota bacterium]
MSVNSNRIAIIPLGGATEIGKNMTVYRVQDRLLVVDCGLMFPDESQLGVDLLIPDISFLLENREKVLGIVLTHGHEDHIGALPYVLKQLAVPIWTTRLTLGLIRRKLHEHGLWADTDWHLAEDGERIQLGPFSVEFVHVNHSVPDSCSLVIRTPLGNIVHTGDFKFDQTPVDGRPADIGALARAGAEGVLALVTDSTNVDKPGYVKSERVVAEGLDRVFRNATGRILIATFASNLSRVQLVLDLAQKYGRRVAPTGRSMIANIDVAQELGYLKVPDGVLLRLEEVGLFPAGQVTILSTGSQGEPLAALSRMAMGDHRQVQIGEGDTVVLSSTAIPGNEGVVYRVINNLVRRGADVIHAPLSPDVHVSGHGNQEELKLMANLTRPRYIIPVHGEPRHLELWRRMGEGMGFPVVKLENGDVLELDREEARITERVTSGVVIVDGSGMSDLEDAVLRDRWHLSQDGIFVVVCSVDSATGRMIAGPDCISRGAVLTTEEEHVYEEA